MAYVANSPEDEEEQKKQAQDKPVEVAGTDASASVPSGKVEYTSPNKTGGQTFTDVAAYLDANKDQAGQVADVIGKNLGESAQSVKDRADKAQQTFQSAEDAGTMKSDSPEIKAALDNPVQYASDEAKATALRNAAQGTYTGPKTITELPDFAKIQNDASEATRRLGLVKTAAGRQELLNTVSQNPTTGQNALNTLLLGQTPEAVSKIEALPDQFGDLSAYLSGKLTAADIYAQQQEAERAAAAEEIQKEFAAAETGLQNDVETRRTALQNLLNGIPADLSALNLTPEEQARLDYSGSQNALNAIIRNLSKYGLTAPAAANYYTPSYFGTDVTPATVASADEIARYAALAGLAGDNASYLTADMVPSPAPDKVGKFAGAQMSDDMARTLFNADVNYLSSNYKGTRDINRFHDAVNRLGIQLPAGWYDQPNRLLVTGLPSQYIPTQYDPKTYNPLATTDIINGLQIGQAGKPMY